MRRIASSLVIGALLWSSPARTEEMVLIVNLQSGVTSLTRDEAVNIYTGRYRRLPSGLIAAPIDIGSDAERGRFYKLLLNKDLRFIDAYWARLSFSGETTPPLQVPDARTAVSVVAGNRSAIAYVPRSEADARVRVVIRVEDIATSAR